MSHYFLNDPNLIESPQTFTYYYNDTKYTISTNSGMFSPDHIDPATDLLLRNIPKLSEGTLLDLGCGYGIIGIVLSKKYNLTVTMIDVNERALKYAKINADSNEVIASIIESDSIANLNSKFNTITLNPPIHAGKETIFRMYEEARDHISENGTFYIVIQKKHGAESTIKKLEELFLTVDIIYKKKGFYIVKSSMVIPH